MYLKYLKSSIVLFFAVSFAFTLPVFGQGLTPLQVAQIENVGSAVISSDGAYAAFTKIVPADPREENKSSSVELHYINLETGEGTHYELSSNPSGLSARPGKGTFTFLMKTEEATHNELAELNPATGDVMRLFSFSTNIISYTWDMNGRRIGFMAREVLEIPESELPYEPDFYEENLAQRLGFVVDLGVADPAPVQIQISGSFYIMKFSPDSGRMAVSVAPTPNVDDQYMFQKIHVIDTTTGEVLNLIENKGKIGSIHWSPDGSKLALIAGNDINDPIDGRIMMVNATGGTPENIYPDFLGKFEQIKWTSDDTIHFLASEGVWSTFGTISPDGTNKTNIIDVGGPIKRSFSVSDNGQIIFVADSPEFPRELFLFNNEGEFERLTNLNPWLDDVDMGVQEVISYPARDGLVIEGLLIRPFNESETIRYPMITVVHGGPEAHYSNGWLTGYSLPGQLMAARGFAVFYPNYRGSTGRGLEYILSSQGDLAGAEFDDIVDGVDFLIESELVDPDRVGVTGGSYGGYATAWMSTYYSDRFAAGLMFVGISNNISKWGTSDIPEELYLVHSRKRIWDYWDDSLKRSPVYYVERSQTPLLIIHGANDTRVHPAQSLELYRHIKVRKPEVPLRLVFYPGEGHGNTKSTSRFDYTLRMIQWFETYLKQDNPVMPPLHLNLSDFGVSMD